MNAVRRTSFVISSACVVTVMWAGLALAVPGVLDSTFGGDGRVTTKFAGGFAGANSVAIQATGRSWPQAEPEEEAGVSPWPVTT